MAAARNRSANARSAVPVSRRAKTDRCQARLRVDQFLWLRRRERHSHPAEVGMSISYTYPEGRVKQATTFSVEDWSKVAHPPEKRSEHVLVQGVGAVSPAGWGVAALRAALDKGEPLPVKELARPG